MLYSDQDLALPYNSVKKMPTKGIINRRNQNHSASSLLFLRKAFDALDHIEVLSDLVDDALLLRRSCDAARCKVSIKTTTDGNFD